MTQRSCLLLSAAVIAAMLAAAVWTGSHLPDGPLPVHWGLDGRPDAFAGKWLALLLLPGFILLLVAVMASLQAWEPMSDNLAKSRGLIVALWIGMLVVMGAAELMVLGSAWHWSFAGPRLLIAAIGLLFALAGNQLGKTRPMHLAGIRTPWTLKDEDVWIGTHRLAGKLMASAGLLWIAAAAVGYIGPYALMILIAAELIAALAPIPYSYLLWQRREKSPAATR